MLTPLGNSGKTERPAGDPQPTEPQDPSPSAPTIPIPKVDIGTADAATVPRRRVETPPPASPKSDLGAKGKAASPDGFMMVLEDERGRQVRAEGREIVIGRERSCGLPMTAAEISRRHAVVRRGGAGFLLAVLATGNITEINGTEIKKEAPIREGDEITLGGYRLKVRELKALS
jgi:pSer/pThr/pTyr-binding forkhead associated (FHA) protein